MKATYHGHSVVSLETKKGVKLLIDPFITGHDACDLDATTVEADYILVTHAHADHLGDTINIAKRTKAQVITTVELAEYLDSFDLDTHGMQPGGAYEFGFGRIKFTQAVHGSSLTIDGIPTTLGLASGIMVTVDGQTVYHLGDTALYSDMKLIGELNEIDLAFIPIGDNFTMGPADATIAADWLKAKKVVPIHYNTFPIIKQDPEAFIAGLKENEGLVPEIGVAFKVEE